MSARAFPWFLASTLTLLCVSTTGCKRAPKSMAYPADVAAMPAPAAERYNHIDDNGFIASAQDPISTFSVDVDTASYSNVRRFVENAQRPPADAVRVEELINYFEYAYPEPQGPHPFSITSEVGPCPWQPDHRIVHLGIQGKHIAPDDAPPRNLVFLIDVSGSMQADDKLGLLKGGLRLLANDLREEDRVSIVVYAGASGVALQPTNRSGAVKRALSRLRAGGSTAGAEGLTLAYEVASRNFQEGAVNRVILASDGDFNVGVSDQDGLVSLIEKQRETGVYLSVLGFGTGNLNDAMMEQIADHGNGNYAYIDSLDEARKVLVDQSTSTLVPIANDVKLQVEFDPEQVEEYRLVGYENRLLDDEDFTDDRKDAGDVGAGHTVTALYEVVLAQSEGTDSLDGAPVHVNVRYKKPGSDQSELVEHTVEGPVLAMNETSTNFRFSAAVAMFGMVLRESPNAGTASLGDVLELARGAVGPDVRGDRHEFIKLAQLATKVAD